MRLRNVAALLGLFVFGSFFFVETKANACINPTWTSIDRCSCISKDWGYLVCFTNGETCSVLGSCGGGPPIQPL